MNRPDPRRNRYGQYVIKGKGGKDESYVRVTTFAKTLSDTFGLDKWRNRQTALGLSIRPDLLARVAAARDGDSASLDSIIEKAQEAAQASKGANLGTALHEFTERVDLGELDLAAIPEPWHSDIAAYAATMRAHGLTVLTEHIEAVCVIQSLGLAGTMDRIVRAPDGRLLIADVKTGGIEWGMGDIAVQLACYANATSLYDYASESHLPMPDVDRSTAIVIHLPAGKGECTLHEVDIAAGWEAAQLAEQVRGWRKRKNLSRAMPVSSKDLAANPVFASIATAPLEDEVMADARRRAIAAHPSTPPVTPADETAYRATVERFVAFPPDAKVWVAQHWPVDAPTFKAHNAGEPLTAPDLDRIVKTLDDAEAKFAMPFPPDTTTPVAIAKPSPDVPAEIMARIDEGATLTDNELSMVKARIDALPADVKTALSAMTKDAHVAGCGFGLGGNPTRRRADLVLALIHLARRGATGNDEASRLRALAEANDPPSA